MKANLKRRKLLFKAKTQLVNSCSGQVGDERHSTKVDGLMHSEDAKNADLGGEHLQRKEKNQNGRERLGVGSRKGNGEEEGADLLPPSL
jgi:hypothetical protein